jgi:hypothetical protein
MKRYEAGPVLRPRCAPVQLRDLYPPVKHRPAGGRPQKHDNRRIDHCELPEKMFSSVPHHFSRGRAPERKIVDRTGDEHLVVDQPDIPNHLSQQPAGSAHKRPPCPSFVLSGRFSDKDHPGLRAAFPRHRLSGAAFLAGLATRDLVCDAQKSTCFCTSQRSQAIGPGRS